MIENTRVKAAYDFCQKQKENKVYRSRVNNMPAMIKMNGMAAATAFLFSKKQSKKPNEVPYWQLYQDIQAWLISKSMIKEGLMEELTQMNSDSYQMITMETLALLNWMKRFADAFCKESKEEAND